MKWIEKGKTEELREKSNEDREHRAYCRLVRRRGRYRRRRRRCQGQGWRGGADWWASDASSMHPFSWRTLQCVFHFQIPFYSSLPSFLLTHSLCFAFLSFLPPLLGSRDPAQITTLFKAHFFLLLSSGWNWSPRSPWAGGVWCYDDFG